jgi:hypothetical protein
VASPQHFAPRPRSFRRRKTWRGASRARSSVDADPKCPPLPTTYCGTAELPATHLLGLHAHLLVRSKVGRARVPL